MSKISFLFALLLFSINSYAQQINEISYAKEVAAPEYLGSNVNSPFAERLPIISPDGNTLYFARKYHPFNIGAERQDDIWVSYRMPDGSWSQARNIGEPLNNDKHNFVCATSPDGNTLYLANDYSKRNMKDGLSVSRKAKNGWSFPKALNIKNHYNRNPFVGYHVGVDEQTMLMTVERDEGFGDRDIYVSFRYSDGNWSEPRNLGKTINTRGMEASVFLSADNKTIYFSSDGLPGYGGLDVFMSKRLDDSWQNWSTPVNLGRKINKPGHDFNYTVPASGEYAYFSSDFESQVAGMSNLYRIRLPEEVRPEPVQLIKGRLIDGATNEPVADIPGEYQIVVPYDNAKANLLTDLQGYFVSESPDTESTPDIEDLDYDGDDPALIPDVVKKETPEDPEIKKQQQELKALREQLASLEYELNKKEQEPAPVADYAPIEIPQQREKKPNPRLNSLKEKYSSIWDDEPVAYVEKPPLQIREEPDIPVRTEPVQPRKPNAKEDLYSSLFEPDPVSERPEPKVNPEPTPEISEPPVEDIEPSQLSAPEKETPVASPRKPDPALAEKQRKYAELFGDPPPAEPPAPPVPVSLIEDEPQSDERVEDYQPPEEPVADEPESNDQPADEPQNVPPVVEKQSFEDLEAKVRKELEDEMRDEIRKQLENDLLPGVQENLKDDLRDDLREDVENQLREDLKEEIQTNLESDLRPEIEDQLKEDLRDGVKKELHDQLREEVENQLREALREEMEEEVRDQLRKEMEQKLKSEEQRLRREIENKLRKQMQERERDIAQNNSFPDPEEETPAYRELEKDIVLYPIRVGQIIPMDNIYFDANKTNLKDASFIELEKVLDFLNNNKNLVIEISGHTNGLCSTAFAEELSDGRAKIVTEYLIEQGINGKRLSFRGYGKTMPVATNNTMEGRKKNQRVEMKILEILQKE